MRGGGVLRKNEPAGRSIRGQGDIAVLAPESEETRMNDPVSATIAFLMQNFTLTFLAIAVIVAVIVILVRRPGAHGVWHAFLSWFLFFAIGVTYIYNAVFHIFFGDMAAASIGWENNGFQTEVGFASLGIGIVGIMAFPRRAPYSLKLASLVGPACFLWGAAGAHIIDIIETGNMAPNNAGVILYTDILIPIIGVVLLVGAYLTRPKGRVAAAAIGADPAPA